MVSASTNGVSFDVVARDELPLRRTESVASTTAPDGEELQIDRDSVNPFVFVLRGEKLATVVDVSAIMQEALLHVVRKNA